MKCRYDNVQGRLIQNKMDQVKAMQGRQSSQWNELLKDNPCQELQRITSSADATHNNNNVYTESVGRNEVDIYITWTCTKR